jgi:hypothetical protein
MFKNVSCSSEKTIEPAEPPPCNNLSKMSHYSSFEYIYDKSVLSNEKAEIYKNDIENKKRIIFLHFLIFLFNGLEN